MRHETHIPAQQNQAQEDIWIPRSHEDSGGQEGYQTPPPSRTQEPGRLKYSKCFRLRKRREFLNLQKKGQRLVGKCICLDYRLTESDLPKLGVTASSRYGNAPERSRFKRLAREAFRKSRPYLPSHIELHVVPRQRAKGASEEQIRLEMTGLIQSAIKDHFHAQS